jgi:hypothetical protein
MVDTGGGGGFQACEPSGLSAEGDSTSPEVKRSDAMQGVTMTRRAVLRTALGALGACSVTARRLAGAAPPELALPVSTHEERFDFEATGLDG